MSAAWPWITLALLGVYHGINPGMGWLFAVSLGLQERKREAVVRAFAPIALGHFASIAAVVSLVAALQMSVDPNLLRWAGGTLLIAFGIYKLVAPMSHPRWVGMRVGAKQLAMWSFLMATAHGAGLMVVPVVLKMDAKALASTPALAQPLPHVRNVSTGETQPPECHTETDTSNPPVVGTGAKTETVSASNDTPACHAEVGKMARGGAGMLPALAGVGLHTLAMFVAMAGVALIVYDRIGLRILRTAWVNLDLIWAVALIAAGILTVIM